VVETTRRQAIEDAASSLFRERGYAGTSVRDIARAVDIQGASLYAHVTSKQEVLWSIVERVAERFESAADALASAEIGPAASGRGAYLTALVRAHVGVITDDVERASVFVHEWRALQGDRRTEIVQRRDAYETRFRAVIADGIRTGAFQVPDPHVAAAYILTSLNGLVGWYRPDGRLSAHAIADIYADLSLRAVRSVAGPVDADTRLAASPFGRPGPPTIAR
jgi:AcrR family transcriptional regulator